MKIKQRLIVNLRWEIGTGALMEIGMDPINGFDGNHHMPITLIMYNHNLGIYFLNQIQVSHDSTFLYPSWICSWDLGFYGDLEETWER